MNIYGCRIVTHVSGLEPLGEGNSDHDGFVSIVSRLIYDDKGEITGNDDSVTRGPFMTVREAVDAARAWDQESTETIPQTAADAKLAAFLDEWKSAAEKQHAERKAEIQAKADAAAQAKVDEQAKLDAEGNRKSDAPKEGPPFTELPTETSAEVPTAEIKPPETTATPTAEAPVQ